MWQGWDSAHACVCVCVEAAAAMGHLVELGSVKVSCTAVMLRGCDVDMKVLNKLVLVTWV